VPDQPQPQARAMNDEEDDDDDDEELMDDQEGVEEIFVSPPCVCKALSVLTQRAIVGNRCWRHGDIGRTSSS